ncbi:hypothetical protein M0813_17445 [Anaeramoeba flamelloides]|uniref:Uncharacterized protein n=1 Tax=Anaeramoeba flamelloides TaxID=1746091 RepID=A0ABQ8YVW3_9EUKA|nr:hypothetical protein M0813_17445 [Anaeramoeba flamelloides]
MTLFVDLFQNNQKLQSLKQDVQSILESDEDFDFPNSSSSDLDSSTLDLQKRAMLKIKQFQETSKSQNVLSRKKLAFNQFQNKVQRKGFISHNDFVNSKNTKQFKNKIKNLNTVFGSESNSDYGDEFGFSVSGSDSGSESGNDKDEKVKKNKITQNLDNFKESDEDSDNSFWGSNSNSNSNSNSSSSESESDSDSDSQVKLNQNKNKKTKQNKKIQESQDSEDDEFSDF